VRGRPRAISALGFRSHEPTFEELSKYLIQTGATDTKRPL
jgi:hypothetical protein